MQYIDPLEKQKQNILGDFQKEFPAIFNQIQNLKIVEENFKISVIVSYDGTEDIYGK